MRMQFINKAIESRVGKLVAEGYDRIPYKYYHYRSIPAGTLLTKYNFFHQVIGDTDGTISLTEEDTNMDKKTEFSYPFLAQNLSAIILPSRAEEDFVEEKDTSAGDWAMKKILANDILKLYHAGVVKLLVQSKEIFKVSPLILVPSAMGVSGSLALSSSKSDSSKIYIGALTINGVDKKMPIEVLFGDGIKFDFTLEYQRGVITTYNDLRIGFVLDGILFRK